jgi:hypothetical protein
MRYAKSKFKFLGSLITAAFAFFAMALAPWASTRARGYGQFQGGEGIDLGEVSAGGSPIKQKARARGSRDSVGSKCYVGSQQQPDAAPASTAGQQSRRAADYGGPGIAKGAAHLRRSDEVQQRSFA